ncbi:MAG: cytochrome c-type biogenesis protein CcmH [Pseudoalteromonas tetraodonis]|jgi:cytochrome c-type biogenesis protein CcmH|uniref:Cytochrome c-type biogenesis protein n=4 Tax=Pseudoalteromonas TaxID=53246 RepID=A0A9W4QSV5_PSEHA|nr:MULTISPECIES: cytochrome c-type biogenesis protein [Pseudoalteromonas]PHQ94663.1 MAG: cytochrome c-type biogenesis protein CcmH [Pseudoalteromonas sp.]ADT69134.1 cytochrome c-type biogenesis protein CcmH [Pseudoalteromonas sp. SM9913]ALQ55439.1 Cytochrome c-type biogenesis protein CcmH [Pseudoalteromonas issachenkonii]ATC91292.1 cytochrome c-type biogenesis protein CcmH [Pseudoalteromonas issachenkonii]ATD03847.1 cytochrome c-type biogenesis protein CcmH [Pseudoalteromonas tetraodonis]|tara:strand:- start:2561 stop:3022 length:462 start_codon:yes stop_codon:yes gene_type:complete
MRLFLLTLSLFVSVAAFAQQDRYQFDSNEQAVRFEELTKELRCPKCQNQNIADSDAVVAKDLRERVLALVKDGKTKDEVIDYMIDRYGYFVHYDPPVTPATLILWVLPVLIVIIGFGFIVIRQRKASVKQTWSDADEVMLNKLIKQNKHQEQS